MIDSPTSLSNWTVGYTKTIQWHSSFSSLLTVNIRLSRDGGATFQTLFFNTPNDGAENWIVTGPGSSQCVIRVEQNRDVTSYGLSSNFKISAKTMTVARPNGGEVWTVGSQQTILWDSNVCGNVNILLSRDGGVTYEALISNTPNDGAQPWTVTGSASSTCRIQVIESLPSAESSGPAQISDTSDANFTISSPTPTVQITGTSFSPLSVAIGGDATTFTVNVAYSADMAGASITMHVQPISTTSFVSGCTNVITTPPPDQSRTVPTSGPLTFSFLVTPGSIESNACPGTVTYQATFVLSSLPAGTTVLSPTAWRHSPVDDAGERSD